MNGATIGGEDHDYVIHLDTIIVGGGLSGATAFHHLACHYCSSVSATNIAPVDGVGAAASSGADDRCDYDYRLALVEARDRCGGRSCTTTFQPPANNNNNCPRSSESGDAPVKVDVGGQWLGTCHTEMLSLCEMLGLEVEEQVFPPANHNNNNNSSGSTKKEESLIEMAYYQLKQVSEEAQEDIQRFESFLQECYLRLDGLIQQTKGNASDDTKANKDDSLEACKLMLKEEEEAWDQISFQEMVQQHCLLEESREQYAYFCQTVLAVDPSQCSFLFFLYYVYIWGSGGADGMSVLGDGPDGLQALKVKGGTQQISEGLIKKGLDLSKESKMNKGKTLDAKVYYKCELQSVDYGSHLNDIVVVTCAVTTAASGDAENQPHHGKVVKRRIFHCSHVILAMSPSLLNKSVAFRPNLSHYRRALYDSLVMGCAIKVIVAFDEPFWRDTNSNVDQEQEGTSSELQQNQLSISAVGVVSNIFESNVGSFPALICLLTGHHARKYHATSSKDERQQLVLSQLKTMYPSYHKRSVTGTGESSVQMIAYIEKDWMAERYSGGCFAAVVKPSSTSAFANHKHLLREPIVPGKVFVAGTESSTRFFGYLEGATLAGKRAATEVVMAAATS